LTITNEWRDQKPLWGHPFHQMCSYMAMFPASIPHYFIDRFTREGDLVLDPMCGRGTTPTQAVAEGRVGIGNDRNPLAYLLTKAKVEAPARDSLDERLSDLRRSTKGRTPTGDVPEEISMLFHPETLRQLCALREDLDVESSREDCFLAACITGILHGSSQGFLSLSMPNTFSMSPNYIRRYVADHGLRPPRRDVFEALTSKISRLYGDGRPIGDGRVHRLDVRDLHTVVKPGSVQLIVTSPPYLKVIKYGLYNWIRLWFLGEDPRKVDDVLDDTHTLPRYLEFMHVALGEMSRTLAPDGICVVVIGDVKGLNLAETVWDEVGKGTGLRKYGVVADALKGEEKVTRIWGGRRGLATDVDRFLILYKGAVEPVKAKVDWRVHYRGRDRRTPLEAYG
jgi:site-specific DNA-methyltransferase (adenine-specific)